MKLLGIKVAQISECLWNVTKQIWYSGN